MKTVSIAEELKNNSYPGRGIIIGRTPDGKKAVTAYFIMGRSENSRNRVFVEEGEGIRTQAFDPAKLEDPSLIIYAPVRVLGNKTIVTNGDQTDTIYEGMDRQMTFEQSLRSREFEPDELLARRGYAKEIRNRYASAVPDYGEDNVRAAGQAGTHSVQHPVIESGRTREQSDRNVEH